MIVVHDVGMDASRLATDFWESSMSRLRKKHVHGFLNKDGTFAVVNDFHRKGAGVVYQGTLMGQWIKWVMLNIETTPVVELDDGDTDRASGPKRSEDRSPSPDRLSFWRHIRLTKASPVSRLLSTFHMRYSQIVNSRCVHT